jgi:hypothetical protein
MLLPPLPDGFAETRDALHQIAYFALAPARYRAVGRMGLQPAPGGFGTPEFDGSVARVEGDTLVFETEDGIATRLLTTVREATRFLGQDYEIEWFSTFRDPLSPVDPDAPLHVDDAAARVLGQWFHFGFTVLETLREAGGPGAAASEVQLWPEHFDPATELGDERAGTRASYGASPGDALHAEPYVYVSPWGEVDIADPYWNDEAFGGASMTYTELRKAGDSVDRAHEFLYQGYRILREA